MRNLLLFLIVLIAVYYVRRMLAGDKSEDGSPPADVSPSAAPQGEAEQVLPCAHCDLLVPASECIDREGVFYCSIEHANQGPAAR